MLRDRLDGRADDRCSNPLEPCERPGDRAHQGAEKMTSKRSQSHSSPKLLRHTARYGLASLLLGGTVVGTGCLDRPIEQSTPTTTNVVVQKQANSAITGIDLLLMIDNSSSMADKQATLAAAVPQLLGELVAPNCVDASGNSATPAVAATLGSSDPCRQQGLEFA